MASKRQAEEAPSDNTYLVCPLTDDTIEAIRAEAYKSREKKTLAQERRAARLRKREIEKRDPKELRRLREAGVLLPDSGISCIDDFKEFNEFTKAFNNPLSYTQFVRRAFYWQLNKEQMQRAVAWYYGWEKWSEDPWGSFLKFCEWMTSARDNEMAVWAVNETSMGRDYLVHSILDGLGQLNYSEMTNGDLLTQIGYGAACFLHAKNYTGWDDFRYHYPGEPLPVALLNEKVSKVYPFDLKLPYSEMTPIVIAKADGRLDIPERVRQNSFEGLEDFPGLFINARDYGPFTSYRFLVFGIYLWMWAIAGANERALEHPRDYLTLEGFLNYSAATNTQLAEVCQKLAPKDYRPPDKNQAWGKIEQALKNGLEKRDKEYGAKLITSPVTAQGALLDIVSAIVNAKASKAKISNPYQATLAGLEGWLGYTLLSAVKNDLKDAVEKEKPLGRKMAEILKGKSNIEPESEQEKQAANYISYEEQQAALKHLAYEIDLQTGRTFGSLDELVEMKEDDVTRLRNLGLDLDKLPPSQHLAVMRYFQAFREGATSDSKQENSLKQALGEDYEKMKRAFSRARARLNKQ